MSNKNGFNLKEDLITLFKDKNYVMLLISFSLTYSGAIVAQTVISNLSEPYGYSSSSTSVFGGAFVVAGVAMSVVFSIILDRYQSFNKVLWCIISVTALATAGTLYTLPKGNVPLFAANMFVLGGFLLPVGPIGISYTTELAYPVSEVAATGINIMIAQVLGVATSYGGTALIE